MPFGKTWSEELVAEWLCLDGYLVETGLRVGRNEIDVVGAKIKANSLEIVHAEVGNLASNLQKNRQTVSNKFKPHIITTIKNYFRNKMGSKKLQINYIKKYVATYLPEKQLQTLSNLLNTTGISLLTLPNLIDEIKKSLKNYQPPSMPGPGYIAPEGLWMVKLIESMSKTWEII